MANLLLLASACPPPSIRSAYYVKVIIPLQGRVKQSVLAARSAPEACLPPQQQSLLIRFPRRARSCARKRERSAERRIQPMSAPHRQTLPPANARARKRANTGRARLPALHCGTSPIARLISGPRFLELPGANGRTLPGASAASTSRTGHGAGRDDAQSRPGAGLRAPARGNRSRSAVGTSPVTPSMSEIRYNVAETGTDVKGNVAVTETIFLGGKPFPISTASTFSKCSRTVAGVRP